MIQRNVACNYLHQGKNKQGFTLLGKFSCARYLLVGASPGWRSSTYELQGWVAHTQLWLKLDSSIQAGPSLYHWASPSLLNHVVQRQYQVKGSIWAAWTIKSQQGPALRSMSEQERRSLLYEYPHQPSIFFSINHTNQLPVRQWLPGDH